MNTRVFAPRLCIRLGVQAAAQTAARTDVVATTSPKLEAQLTASLWTLMTAKIDAPATAISRFRLQSLTIKKMRIDESEWAKREATRNQCGEVPRNSKTVANIRVWSGRQKEGGRVGNPSREPAHDLSTA
jgi:hypothetical protein